MIITITTSSKYREMVLEIMESLNLLYPCEVSGRGMTIGLQFPNDEAYWPIAQWAGDAIGCGLIFGFERKG